MNLQEMNLSNLAGNYYVISPYHKNKKKLPFNIDRCGCVQTIEYKGKTAYLRIGYYSLENVLSLIESNIIHKGSVSFPNYKVPDFY